MQSMNVGLVTASLLFSLCFVDLIILQDMYGGGGGGGGLSPLPAISGVQVESTTSVDVVVVVVQLLSQQVDHQRSSPMLLRKKRNAKGIQLNISVAKGLGFLGQSVAINGTLREFLKDISLSLMFAGRDTTSTCLTWLFWLLGKNPTAETKILEEMEAELSLKSKWRPFTAEESHRLVYLHGALCESRRLFPPVALEHKAPVSPDILPSGCYLSSNGKLIISFYSVGRMESVWGKDCLEFKPDRWISPSGKIKHEPSYKFPAFNAGPRTCLGKEMAFVQMKMVAAAILFGYKVRLLEGHKVSPRDSIILHAREGLKVLLSKRN